MTPSALCVNCYLCPCVIPFMTSNPGSQVEAFDILFDVSREIDLKYGTNVTSDLWDNIINELFTEF
jgi:hypothetical protein